MDIIQSFGQHAARIDPEITRTFYRTHRELRSTDQAHRNYVRWLDGLTGEVDSFFRSIGVDDHYQCHIFECYVEENGLIHIAPLYCVAGEVVQEPESFDTVAAFLPYVCCGEAKLFIVREGSFMASDGPQNRFMSGQLMLGMMREIPWLLDEPCQLQTREQFFTAREARWHAEMESEMYKMLDDTGQPYEAMTAEQAEALKRKCIDAYVKPTDRSKADRICWTSEHDGRGFLWHVFSYGLCSAIKGDEARAQYNALWASGYFVYVEEDGYCFHVKGSQLPNLSAIEGLPDTYVIAESLDWLYAHTHEDGWYGPYFAMHT